MNHEKVLCLGLALICSSSGYAKLKRLNIENIFKSESKESSTSLLLRCQNIGIKVKHNETSSTSGFTALGETSDINVNNISIEATQEFFSKNYFSISIGARFGINKGSEKASNDTTNFSYKDIVSGKSYGGGLSFNLNTEGYGLKVQPFISSYYIISNNDFELSYNDTTSTEDPFNINYSVDTSILQHSFGLRLINKKDLMSYFSIDYLQELNSSSTASGQQSGKNLQLSNTSSVDQNGFGFSIGVGFLF